MTLRRDNAGVVNDGTGIPHSVLSSPRSRSHPFAVALAAVLVLSLALWAALVVALLYL